MRRGRSRVAQAGSLAADAPDRSPPIDEQIAEQECLRLALKSLQTLPEQQREALYLRACEGLSAAEIATVLGTSADSVKASLCVARGKLRKLLENLMLVL